MSRVQLALNVNDIDEAVTFYSKLFGTEPAKRRPGYANFAIAEPPLKLVLLENPGQGGSLNHLGVEVADISAVDAEQTRLAATGLDLADERDTTCCYAKQDKFWIKNAPDGESWEFYTVLEDSATFYGQDDSQAACGGPAGSSAETAAVERPAAGAAAAHHGDHRAARCSEARLLARYRRAAPVPADHEPPGQAHLTGGDHIGMSRVTSTKVKRTTQ